MLKWAMIVTRWAFTVFLVFLVYTETGYFTLLFAVLVAVTLELQVWVNKVQTEANKATLELLEMFCKEGD